MSKKIINRSDANRVGLDKMSFNINFSCNKKIKIELKHYKKMYYFALDNGMKIYVKKGKNNRHDLRADIFLNGYELAQNHLQNAYNICCFQDIKINKKSSNFIPIELISSEQIKYRRLWRFEVPLLIFNKLENTKKYIESQFKKLLPDIEISFDNYSIYSMEVAIDIVTLDGCRLAELKQVKTALTSFCENINSSIFTNEEGGRTIYQTEDRINRDGVPNLRGQFYSGMGFNIYAKKNTESSATNDLLNQILNRCELKLKNPKHIKCITSDQCNSFTDFEKFVVYNEDFLNYWFNFLYNILGVVYNTKDEETIINEWKTIIANEHIKNSFYIIRDLFEYGKLWINEKYVNKKIIYRMERNGILCKNDNSITGRCFYSLNKNFKNEIINSLKGNRHGIK